MENVNFFSHSPYAHTFQRSLVCSNFRIQTCKKVFKTTSFIRVGILKSRQTRGLLEVWGEKKIHIEDIYACRARENMYSPSAPTKNALLPTKNAHSHTN